MRALVLGLIKVYRYFLSPLMARSCRFYPSCSHYAEEALLRFGLLRGSYMTLCRLLRCHPWHPGGVDLVPKKQEQPVHKDCCVCRSQDKAVIDRH